MEIDTWKKNGGCSSMGGDGKLQASFGEGDQVDHSTSFMWECRVWSVYFTALSVIAFCRACHQTREAFLWPMALPHHNGGSCRAGVCLPYGAQPECHTQQLCQIPFWPSGYQQCSSPDHLGSRWCFSQTSWFAFFTGWSKCIISFWLFHSPNPYAVVPPGPPYF